MNRLLICLLLSLICFGLKAQDEDIDKKPRLNNPSADRLVFEFNHDNWINKPDNIKTRWYNRGINTYVSFDIPLDKNGHVAFAPGAGIGVNNVYHDGIITTDSTNVTYFEPIQSEIDYRNNKLTTAYLEVPIELRFRSKADKNNNRWKFAIGLRGGYLLNAHSKYRGPDLTQSTNRTVKIKDLRLPNINKYRLGSTVRVGYGTFNLVGFYSLTNLFETDLGPGIQQFSIGLCFNSY